MFKQGKLEMKILGPVVIGIIMFALIIGVVTQSIVVRGAKGMASAKAMSDLATIYEVIERELPGSWYVKGTDLYKGETKISGDTRIVDWLGELTGNTITFFRDDTRVATNVTEDGRRAVGTQASQEVIHKVLIQQEEYVGEAQVVGRAYQTAYRPLFDVNGNVIGMLYTGASEELIDEVIRQFVRVLVSISAVVGICLILSLYLVIHHNVVKPVKALANILQRISNLDLRVSEQEKDHPLLKRTDEIGEMLRQASLMQTRLLEVVATLHEMGTEITFTSGNLSAFSQQNAATIEEVASSVSEFSATMDQTKHQAEVMHGEANSIEELANNGIKSMSLSKESMEQIVSAALKVRDSLGDLSGQAKNMASILGIISDIADQTNLLALNAAIEAARAGEHGRGFAVVADEVRALAEQTQNSVGDITTMVDQLVSKVEDSSLVMQSAEKSIHNGTELLDKTEDVLREITNKVTATVQLIKEITESIVFMNQSSTSIEEATEEQASSTEEIANSAGDLSGMAQHLDAVVHKFEI